MPNSKSSQYAIDRPPKLSALVLLALMLVPAVGVFRVWPLNSAIVDGLSFLIVSFFVAVVLLVRKDSFLRFNSSSFFFMSLIGVLAISVSLNDYAYGASWRWYLISLVFCLLVTVTGSELKSLSAETFSETLTASLWVGCLAYSVMSLLKYYGALDGVFYWMDPSSGRLSGIWSQPNLTTTTAWLGVLAGSVWLSQRGRLICFAASVLIMGWVIACAASRMSWIMAAGLYVLVAVSRLPRYQTLEVRVVGRWLFWGTTALCIMLIVVPQVNGPFREFLAQIGVLQNGAAISLMERGFSQDAARFAELLKLLSSLGGLSGIEWLFGVGPGNYPAYSYGAESVVSPENLLTATWLHSHNIFTMMFVEFGLAGLALFVCLVAAIAWKALRSDFDLRHFFSVGALGLIFVHSNLEFPLWYPWFLILCCLLLVNLFDVRQIAGDSRALKPVVGGAFFAMTVALLVNVGYQYFRIVNVALDPDPREEEYQSLTLLANDSLMGPYAILRKYRDFPPESVNLDWQLNESRKMKVWQPRNLVVLREYSLLVLKKDPQGACSVSQAVAYRYPPSATVMLEHAAKAGTLDPGEIVEIAGCIEKGLAPRGETISSVEAKNRLKMLQAQ